MRGTVRMVDKNIYIVQGEINTVVGAIKRNARWNTHTHLDEERDPLLHSFSHLKEVLNNIREKPQGNRRGKLHPPIHSPSLSSSSSLLEMSSE
uniref:Golgi brefeldin A resistant guanine nucleotide exchange factor 1 n=1 Tax=Pelusios castaneus TaxID=367368 RepID=A0A8C8RKS0_9SAUR